MINHVWIHKIHDASFGEILRSMRSNIKIKHFQKLDADHVVIKIFTKTLIDWFHWCHPKNDLDFLNHHEDQSSDSWMIQSNYDSWASQLKISMFGESAIRIKENPKIMLVKTDPFSRFMSETLKQWSKCWWICVDLESEESGSWMVLKAPPGSWRGWTRQKLHIFENCEIVFWRHLRTFGSEAFSRFSSKAPVEETMDSIVRSSNPTGAKRWEVDVHDIMLKSWRNPKYPPSWAFINR